MKHRLPLIAGALVAAMVPAFAQPVLAPPPPEAPEAVVPEAPRSPATKLELAVEIVAAPGAVDRDALHAALGVELGVHIGPPTTFAPALGRLAIVVEATSVHLVYEPAAGATVERTLPLPAHPDERVELIAFAATNLVRDQASELLAMLGPIAPPAPPPASSPPAPAPRAPVATTHEIAATIGFVPPIAVDRIAGDDVVVGAGLHALVGMTGGSRVVSISGIADIQTRFATGAQIGGIAAVAGELDGVQIGGIAAVSRGRTSGLQIGGIGTVAGGPMDGIQIGGIANIARDVHGLQIAGIANIGGDVSGAQIGLVNVAKTMRGLQLGLVNISEHSDDAVPIGLVNYAKDGGVHVDAWIESTSVSALALRHGTRRVHNIWAVGASPDHEHVLVGAGLGTTFRLPARTTLDLDAMSWFTNVWNADLDQLNQLRATVAVPVGPIDIFGGIAANVAVTDRMDEVESLNPSFAKRYVSDGGTHVTAWPSVFAGIRVKAL